MKVVKLRLKLVTLPGRRNSYLADAKSAKKTNLLLRLNVPTESTSEQVNPALGLFDVELTLRREGA
jgi:hypothetical protein